MRVAVAIKGSEGRRWVGVRGTKRTKRKSSEVNAMRRAGGNLLRAGVTLLLVDKKDVASEVKLEGKAPRAEGALMRSVPLMDGLVVAREVPLHGEGFRAARFRALEGALADEGKVKGLEVHIKGTKSSG